MESVIGRVLATLVTVIALAGLGYAAYNGFESNRVSRFSSGLQSLSSEVDQLYATSASTAGLMNLPAANLQQASSLWASSPPVGSVSSTTALVDPWGDALEIYGYGDGGVASAQLTPTEYEVDVESTSMTPGDWQSLMASIGPTLAGAVFNGSTPTTLAQANTGSGTLVGIVIVSGGGSSTPQAQTPAAIAAATAGVTGTTVALIFAR